jgi:Ribbon-helix-helix domain
MTTKPTATCRIDLGLMEELREYSEKTGVPTNRCVEEAVARWLVTVAPARLEAMARTGDAARAAVLALQEGSATQKALANKLGKLTSK